MTDRDAFAAAALTGLLAAPTDKDRSMDYWARLAFEAADAMLRERDRVAEIPESQQVAETCRSERQDDGPGDGWRWVAFGDVLQRGDEWFSRWCWDITGNVGFACDQSHKYRRRIDATPPEPPAADVTLTDAEREAFKLAAEWCLAYGGAVYDAGHVIDRFLERLG